MKPTPDILAWCGCETPRVLTSGRPHCKKCGCDRPRGGAICYDPLNVGCANPTPSGISLTKTPHNHSHTNPCQKCRVRRARAERAAKGLPPVRSGAAEMRRL